MAPNSFGEMNREAKLINLIAEESQYAFKEIFDTYHLRIFLFAKKYLKSSHLAEEAVQDVFLKIWEKREELKMVKDFPSWLFQLTKNHLLNTLKKASNDNRIKEEIKATMEVCVDQMDKQLIDKEKSDLLHEVIDTLPTQRQEIFRLCRLEEKSYEEVAQIMGISKSTVNDHMVKAMKYLKSHFQQRIMD